MSEKRYYCVFEIRWIFWIAVLLNGFVLPQECGRVVEIGVETLGRSVCILVCRILVEELARPPVQVTSPRFTTCRYESVEEITDPYASNLRGRYILLACILFAGLGKFQSDCLLSPPSFRGELRASRGVEFVQASTFAAS